MAEQLMRYKITAMLCLLRVLRGQCLTAEIRIKARSGSKPVLIFRPIPTTSSRVRLTSRFRRNGRISTVAQKLYVNLRKYLTVVLSVAASEPVSNLIMHQSFRRSEPRVSKCLWRIPNVQWYFRISFGLFLEHIYLLSSHCFVNM